MIVAKDLDPVTSISPVNGIGYPFTKVHPLPTEQDLKKIQQIIKKALVSSNQQERHSLNPREMPINKDTLENSSKELILKVYMTYERLLVILEAELIQEYREALLLHAFLIAHRITFDQQYMVEGRQVNQVVLDKGTLVGKIKIVFAENSLGINWSKISALFLYTKEGASSQ